MTVRTLTSTLLAMIFLTGVFLPPIPVNAVGKGNIVATSVYWGTNPLAPLNAHPGDVNVQLSIVLSNIGDDVARDVNATLTIGPPLSYTYYIDGKEYTASEVSKMAGDMQPGQSFTLGYTVNIDPGAGEGTYRYILRISYRTARELQQIEKSTIVDVPVWRGDLRIQNVITLPTKIYPGNKQVQLKVLIVNSGLGAAKDLQLRLDLKDPFKPSSSGSDRHYVGTLPAGQLSEANFIVDIDENAKFGKYFAPLAIEVDGKSIQIGEVPIYLNEKVKFEVAGYTPTTLRVGDTGRVVRVELRNTGSVKADSVRVQLRVGNFYSGTLTDFLGTVIPGESKVAFFTIDVDSKAIPREYAFDLRLDWTQEDNPLDDTLRLSFELEPPAAPVTMMILLLIVAVAVGWYLLVRRRGVSFKLPRLKR
ncbi:MAG: hypothetical protein QXO25_06400 [Candidatus Bathyarchaeia archaeon]